MSKVPGMAKAIMAFVTIYALLEVARIAESPTAGHVFSAALSVAFAAIVDVIVWRTFTRKHE